MGSNAFYYFLDTMAMKIQEAASANGIQMHYVIEGQVETAVLLHGWPQTCYE